MESSSLLTTHVFGTVHFVGVVRVFGCCRVGHGPHRLSTIGTLDAVGSLHVLDQVA
jgi:hypothetical protein